MVMDAQDLQNFFLKPASETVKTLNPCSERELNIAEAALSLTYYAVSIWNKMDQITNLYQNVAPQLDANAVEENTEIKYFKSRRDRMAHLYKETMGRLTSYEADIMSNDPEIRARQQRMAADWANDPNLRTVGRQHTLASMYKTNEEKGIQERLEQPGSVPQWSPLSILYSSLSASWPAGSQ